MLLLLAGCLTRENYFEHSIGIVCERAEECDRAAFEASYDDQGECQEELYDGYEDIEACVIENCEFDPRAARSCLASMRTDSCEDVVAGSTGPDCDEVFVECDDSDLLACGMDAVF